MKNTKKDEEQTFKSSEVMMMLESLQDTITTLYEGLDVKMDKGFREVKEEIKILDKRVGKVEKKVDNLEVKIDKLEDKVDGLETRFDNFEVRFDDLDDKVDGIQEDVTEIKHKLSEKVDKEEFDKRLVLNKI